VVNILDDPSLSLWRFLQAPPTNISIVVRAALKSWIVPIFTQFKSFDCAGIWSRATICGSRLAAARLQKMRPRRAVEQNIKQRKLTADRPKPSMKVTTR